MFINYQAGILRLLGLKIFHVVARLLFTLQKGEANIEIYCLQTPALIIGNGFIRAPRPFNKISLQREADKNMKLC